MSDRVRESERVGEEEEFRDKKEEESEIKGGRESGGEDAG